MKRALLIFALSVLICCPAAFPVEETKVEIKTIEQVKEQLKENKVTTRNASMRDIKQIGVDKFVASYKTEKDQLAFIDQINWGSSETDTSMVRADLLVRLLESEFDEVKIKAAFGLKRYALYADQQDAAKKLIANMESKNPALRLETIKCLEKLDSTKPFGNRPGIKREEVVGMLVKYLQDDDTQVLTAIIGLFPKTKDAKIADSVKKLLANKKPENRRLAFAFFSDNEIKDDEVHKAAIKTLGDPLQPVLLLRASARYAGVMGDKNAVPLIGKLLKTYSTDKTYAKNEDVKIFKITALRALTKIGGNEALKYCVEILQLKEPTEVIAEAGVAVQTIAKQDFGYETNLVPSQRIISDKKFKIWLIQDYLKEGDKRKDEVASLNKEVEKLSKDLGTTIIMEKLQSPVPELRKKAAEQIYEIGVKKFIADATKYEMKSAVIAGLASIPGDDQFQKKNMEVVCAFLDDKDDNTLITVVQTIDRYSQFVDADVIMPKLEALTKSTNSLLQENAKQALSRLKMIQDYNKNKETKEKPKQKDQPK
jgi:HEAT repeat protein